MKKSVQLFSFVCLSLSLFLANCSQKEAYSPASEEKSKASPSSGSAPADESELQSQLDELQKDPEKFQIQGLEKSTIQGTPAEIFGSQFNRERFLEEKDRFRESLGAPEPQEVEGREGNDPVTDNPYRFLVEMDRSKILSTLEQMEEADLTSATLPFSPWSDYYWPIYQGILGARYRGSGDLQMPETKDFADYVRYAFPETHEGLDQLKEQKLAGFVNQLVSNEPACSVDQLSPSEKYDLLVGESPTATYPGWTLTRQSWIQGLQYYRDEGEVQFWMGICHGWAPAAYMLDRPENAVEVLAADGKTRLKFYPSDIKALGSLLWANTRTSSLFVGGRCNTKISEGEKPEERPESKTCRDNNPRTWHQVVVNKLGVQKETFIMDATFDYEVWNQPVYSYSYYYFNPKTTRLASSIEEAKVAIDEEYATTNELDFLSKEKDRYGEYRAENAVAVVGIIMDVAYTVETLPSRAETDSAKNDALKSARYFYDLELNADGEIIGGEWYHNNHPDFLWTPPKNERALSAVDRYGQQVTLKDGRLNPRYRFDFNRALGLSAKEANQYVANSWDPHEPLPKAWQAAAKSALYQSSGQPLTKIVEDLIAFSRLAEVIGEDPSLDNGSDSENK